LKGSLRAFVCLLGPVALYAQGTGPSVGGCPMFPANHIFNTRIDNLPVHPNSDAYVAELGPGPAHPDWGFTVPGGFPMNIVHGNSVPPATVYITWPFTSDTGPFPIPQDALIGSPSDLHMIVLDVDNCMLYESFDTIHNGDGSWSVDAISKFNLNSYDLKSADWSSSNAAGTAQLPLLVRYDEVAAGHIDHAISMTGYPTGNSYVWPTSHFASATSAAPPMGTRFRLKAGYDISGLAPQARVVAAALKVYGALLTDNGASWHLQGVPDERFDDGDLHSLTQIPASAFEAVDESSLEISSTSGQVVSSSTAPPSAPVPPSSSVPTNQWVNVVSKNSGKCLDVTGISTAAATPLQQWGCWGGDNQKFLFTEVSGGYEVTIMNSGLQLDVSGGPGATQDGAPVIQWPYWGGSNEIWQVTPISDGYFSITALHSGKCLDVSEIATYDGAPIHQWSCWGGDNQKWRLIPIQ
jgi:hypothetical protein